VQQLERGASDDHDVFRIDIIETAGATRG